MAAWRAHPLEMQSVEFKVLDGSFPKTSSIYFKQIGIRVASPTNSMKSISSILRPDTSIDLVKQSLKSLTNASISYSNSSLVKCCFKSSSSKRDSQLISASLFPVKSFLIFSMASRSLSLALISFLGSHPYFFSNCPPKRSVRR